eukprot:TRINITY_DN49621_c0_g1_i1.p1 TRINITY_DN49621_c0_g1~~TRINITY_DN49621_c0_g1_i1.p1  ORF type:complete len:515 (-),score=138.58 TRINITY_DN49621_c0_g1_i1:219-1763(-)
MSAAASRSIQWHFTMAPPVGANAAQRLGGPKPFSKQTDEALMASAASPSFSSSPHRQRKSGAAAVVAMSGVCSVASAFSSRRKRQGRNGFRRSTIPRLEGTEGMVLSYDIKDSASSSLWLEVVEAGSGKGFGLIAPLGAPKGTVLVDEAPLYTQPKHTPASEAVALFHALELSKQQQLLAMAAAPGDPLREVGFAGEELAFLRAFRANSVALPSGGGAVYALSCRANHSCRPNAALRVGHENRMQLTAIRDIAPGEDVLVSYIGEGNLLRPTAWRQKQLHTWGFTCDCVRCTSPEDSTRGFVCPSCGEGTVLARQSCSSGSSWGSCVACGVAPSSEDLSRAEEEWVQHCEALKPEHSAMAVAMFDGLISSLKENPASAPSPSRHWVAAKLAMAAANELTRRGDCEAAVSAAELVCSYVQKTLGNVASRVGAEAKGIKAAAAAQQGDYALAVKLYEDALNEARLLPRTADTVIQKLEEQLQKLKDSSDEAKVIFLDTSAALDAAGCSRINEEILN